MSLPPGRLRQVDGPLIDLQDVVRTHAMAGGEVAALAGVSLAVHAGESLAITGPSGCGKSSLLNLLGLLDRPGAGCHRFAGQDVLALSARELARLRGSCIGFVFQQFHLLPHLSALDNVALPLRYGTLAAGEARRRAGAALEAVGLSARGGHRPAQLSGGQCQRVAIARALAVQPRLLLADEPTGALDSAHGQQVMDLMLALHREHRMTLVVVTHDPAVAQRLARRVALRDGRVVADDRATAAEGGLAREGRMATVDEGRPGGASRAPPDMGRTAQGGQAAPYGAPRHAATTADARTCVPDDDRVPGHGC